MTQSRLGLLIGLLLYTVAIRLLPYVLQNCDVTLDPTIVFYPWNFSPLTAVCLMSGACLADRRLSFVLPLSAMLLSNIGIGLLSGHLEWALPVKPLDGGALTVQLLVSGHFKWAVFSGGWWLPYLAFAGAVWLGTLLRRRGTHHPLLTAVGMGLGFEVAFFAVSNFTYFYGSASMYPQTLAGLLECYAAAWPFFRNASVSTLAFTLLVFGPLGAVVPSEKPVPTNDLVPAPAR